MKKRNPVLQALFYSTLWCLSLASQHLMSAEKLTLSWQSTSVDFTAGGPKRKPKPNAILIPLTGVDGVEDDTTNDEIAGKLLGSFGSAKAGKFLKEGMVDDLPIIAAPVIELDGGTFCITKALGVNGVLAEIFKIKKDLLYGEKCNDSDNYGFFQFDKIYRQAVSQESVSRIVDHIKGAKKAEGKTWLDYLAENNKSIVLEVVWGLGSRRDNNDASIEESAEAKPIVIGIRLLRCYKKLCTFEDGQKIVSSTDYQ